MQLTKQSLFLGTFLILFSKLSLGLGHRSMSCTIGGCAIGGFTLQEQFSSWDLSFYDEGLEELQQLDDSFQKLGITDSNERIDSAYLTLSKKDCMEGRSVLSTLYCKGESEASIRIRTNVKWDDKTHSYLFKWRVVRIKLPIELHPKVSEGQDATWDIFFTYNKHSASTELRLRDCTYGNIQ